MRHVRFAASIFVLMFLNATQGSFAKDSLTTVLAYSAGTKLPAHRSTSHLLSLREIQSSHPVCVVTPGSVGGNQNDSTLSPGQPGTAMRITNEVLVGTGCGVLMGLGGAIVGAGIAAATNHESGSVYGGTMLGVGVGFLAGVPFGVRCVGRDAGKTAGYGGTLLSSLAGAFVGFEINEKFHPKGIAAYSPLLLPLAFSILYVELVE